MRIDWMKLIRKEQEIGFVERSLLLDEECKSLVNIFHI